MKICIVSIVNIKHMSLITHYTSILEENGIDYDIIYIDKYQEEEKIKAKNKYVFQLQIKRSWSIVRKLMEYFKFRKFSKKILLKNNYDLLIIWRTETALLLVDYILKYYKKKIVLNIRDYCFEKNPFIFSITKKIIENSLLTTISSEGFKEFLPEFNYQLLHSYNNSILKELKPNNRLRTKAEPIRICFIGYVRFYENDKKLLKAFANDSRYIIQYFGSGSEELKDYCADNKIYNVQFHEKFNVEETAKLLSEADVINNLYGYDDIALDTAISIKYYYALYLRLPILVFKNTYMAEQTTKLGIGYDIKHDFETLADDFYIWYHSLKFEDLNETCKKEIRNIQEKNHEFENKFKNLLRK